MPVFENILEEFQHYLNNLPDSTPAAAYDDKLANALARHPEIHGDPALQGDELWEAGLNEFLKSVLGWATEEDVESLIKGKEGLERLFNFVKYFIVKRGVSEGLFQGKLTHLFEGIAHRRCYAPRSFTELPLPFPNPSISVTNKSPSAVASIIAETPQVIDVDSPGVEERPKAPKMVVTPILLLCMTRSYFHGTT